MQTELTWERLRQLVSYDPDTGVFTRLVGGPGRGNRVGAVAGGNAGGGYRSINIDGHLYKEHRVAVFYMTGKWPEGVVDHRDRVRSNNRWLNLRDISDELNRQNRTHASAHSLTGMLGVQVVAGGFRGHIGINGRTEYLGTFETPE